MGRPPLYTAELGTAICARLAAGESLRSVCRDETMPCMQSVFSWFKQHPEFLEQYTRAKAECADALVEEMLDIADDESADTNRSRLRVDTRKWIASKLKPKRYGERVALAGDAENPLAVLLTEISGRSTGLPKPLDE